MSQETNKSSKFGLKTGLLIAFILLSIAVSYVKLLDGYSSDYHDQALKQAALTYATVRGINALVSMLQTSTIEGDAIFVSGSVAIGELLDPVNDLIERFSTIMTLALGSLAAQKLLLLITGHEVFLHLLTAAGLAAIASLLLHFQLAFNWLFRFFIVTLFLRFSLVIVLAMNGMVDKGFIWNETERYDQNTRQFQSSIDPDAKIEAAEPSGSDGVESYAKQATDWVAGLNLTDLERKVENSVQDFMMLMAIYMLKTVVFPLLFLYLFYATTRKLWRADYHQFFA